ncbi:hypothetical protein, partial [Actinomycetospora atypica]
MVAAGLATAAALVAAGGLVVVGEWLLAVVAGGIALVAGWNTWASARSVGRLAPRPRTGTTTAAGTTATTRPAAPAAPRTPPAPGGTTTPAALPAGFHRAPVRPVPPVA